MSANKMAGTSQTASPEINLSVVDGIVERSGVGSHVVIPVLQAIQDHFRYLPEEALERVCELTEITRAQVAGVSTFYGQFRHRPMGEHRIQVCHGTACHVAGAPQITEAIRRELNIEGDDDTDAEGLFTVEKVACLGCCSLAPCLTIDEVTYGRLSVRSAPLTMRKFLEEHAS